MLEKHRVHMAKDTQLCIISTRMIFYLYLEKIIPQEISYTGKE